eukprot:21057-Heterococcus_DN1.PRE.3
MLPSNSVLPSQPDSRSTCHDNYTVRQRHVHAISSLTQSPFTLHANNTVLLCLLNGNTTASSKVLNDLAAMTVIVCLSSARYCTIGS